MKFNYLVECYVNKVPENNSKANMKHGELFSSFTELPYNTAV